MRLRRELPWVDCCKGVAMLWIFCNHVSEQLLGGPLIANPSGNWPPLVERVTQLCWLDGYSLGSIALNLFRYVGWAGDQGVGLFLILSGFGLTWGLLGRQGYTPLDLFGFYSRRAERVYPTWWTAHLVFMVTWAFTGFGIAVTDPQTYLSFLGIRATPGLFYYFTPAWWYIGLLIQLYLIYPVLWNALRRWGPVPMLTATCGVAFTIRLIGLLGFHDFVDKWSLGAVFVTRLPEFAFGVFLAARLHADPEEVDARLRSFPVLLFAAAIYLAGTGLALTLAGMTVALFLVGCGGTLLLYSLSPLFARPNLPALTLRWVGRHSYALFLTHQPFVQHFLPIGTPIGGSTVWLRVLEAALASVVFALFLERASDKGMALFRRWCASVGSAGVMLRLGVLLGLAVASLFAAELSIWWLAPQEVLGWGERPSLELHPVFGWRLRPSQVTRLRWESYDYVVTANALGFPGPEYPVDKPAGTFRILTTGDAFTSAEGVDTADAWPRLLEDLLRSNPAGSKVEVLNFAITGYGPNEYAAVVKTFAPIYRPDLILVEFFVNEYEDVLHGPEFAESIGFGRPPAVSWYSLLHLTQLRHFLDVRFRAPLVSLWRGSPEPYGYFLGNFSALERAETEQRAKARALVKARLTEIKNVADQVGAKAMLLLVPAPVQICGPSDLHYFPHHADPEDSTKFDLDRPQRITRSLAEPLGFAVVDLRAVFQQSSDGCPYQAWNMHWKLAGHRQVAKSLAYLLSSEENLKALVERQ
jgi:peptidoglycan/LPS O-acetylase OafA/YrhL